VGYVKCNIDDVAKGALGLAACSDIFCDMQVKYIDVFASLIGIVMV